MVGNNNNSEIQLNRQHIIDNFTWDLYRVGKNPGFLEKPNPPGFFGFYGFFRVLGFLGFFGFFDFFSGFFEFLGFFI